MRVAFVLKGYPRLSETFIAQEIAALERRGLDILIVSLRRPTDARRHPVHDEIRAPVLYLPEYLLLEPLRVLRAWLAGRERWPSYAKRAQLWLRDLRARSDAEPHPPLRPGAGARRRAAAGHRRGCTRISCTRRPRSTRYAALLRGLPWSGSAHAKDIWTTPEWEKREKLARCDWLVTCTAREPRSSRARSRRRGASSSSITASISRAFRRRPRRRARATAAIPPTRW